MVVVLRVACFLEGLEGGMTGEGTTWRVIETVFVVAVAAEKEKQGRQRSW